MKYTFILLVMILFVSGCSFTTPKKNPSPTISETSPLKNPPENKNITIKTPYGFDFSVLEGWQLDHTEPVFPPYKEALIINNPSHPEENFVRIVKEPLAAAPSTTKGIDQGEEVILTKNNILEEKKEIEKTGKNINGVSILSDIRYDVSGGGFYQSAKFFYKDNLITFYFPLNEPFENMTWGDEARKKVAATLEKIKKGEMTEEAKKQKEFFDSIIQSLKFYN